MVPPYTLRYDVNCLQVKSCLDHLSRGPTAMFEPSSKTTLKSTKLSTVEVKDERPPCSIRNKPGDELEVVMENIQTQETTHRQKLTNTAFVLWNMATSGMVMGQIGLLLPDLQRITGSSLQEASWLFTGHGLGYIFGCLLSGFAMKRFSSRLIQFVLTFCTAVTTAILPWIPIFVVSVLIRVLQGCSIGGQATVNHAIIFQIWGTGGGPYVQMIYTAIGVGGFLSPLYTKPFLRNEEESHDGTGISAGNLTTVPLTTLNTTNTGLQPIGIRVHFAFFITAALCLSSALPFLLAHTCKLRDISTPVQNRKEESNTTTLPVYWKYFILALCCGMSFIIRGCILNFPNFFPTFVIRQLDWSQHSASTLVSLRYVALFFGTLIGIVFIKLASTNKLIIAANIASIVSLVCCIPGSIFGQTVVIWVALIALCLTTAVFQPTLYTWIEENVTHVSGNVASTLILTGSAGLMVFPILAGYLMDLYSPMWFLYLNLGGFVLCLILFISAFALVKYFKQKATVRGQSVV